MKFSESNWVVGFIDAEFGIIELHNIYSREKIYCPLPDGDELEAWAMNILALMRRAYEAGVEDQKRRQFQVVKGGATGQRDIQQMAVAGRDHDVPDSSDT